MKYLSYILITWILLLSTAPCCLQDKCLFHDLNNEKETSCHHNDSDSCTECCSPFLHCNTCTGCPVPNLFYLPFVITNPIDDASTFYYDEDLTYQFSSSIWQPPKQVA